MVIVKYDKLFKYPTEVQIYSNLIRDSEEKFVPVLL